jgi:monoamine oxidase
MEICDDYGADLAALSALSFDQDDVLSPTDAVPCTYQRIVEAVLAPVQDLVRYQHCVMHMDFPDDSSGRVRLQCRVGVGDKDNGDESEQRQVEVSARRVISTLPLGVLQQQSAQLFQPPLPPPLQASLGRLGYGCLEKVWLVFDTATAEEPFWPTDTDVFYHGGASPTPFRSWFLPAQVYQNDDYRHVLCCFVSGTAARALADQSADAVGAAALAALRQVFAIGSQHVLRHVHVTRWSKDPWSGGGSYSHMAVGSTAADYTVWTHGFYDQRLWWAGEATSARYPGTVHGAYFSGERAAQDCLASLP